MQDFININGLRFRVNVEHDNGMGAPWQEHDGHGVVSEWTTRDKRPGERELCSDRGSKRYYDFQASIAIARKDQWGVDEPKGKTRRQIAAEAVERDFQHLRAWCNDEWHWVGVVVELLGVNGSAVPGYRESLWGIESEDRECLEQTARELAEQIAAQVGDVDRVCISVRNPSTIHMEAAQ